MCFRHLASKIPRHNTNQSRWNQLAENKNKGDHVFQCLEETKRNKAETVFENPNYKRVFFFFKYWEVYIPMYPHKSYVRVRTHTQTLSINQPKVAKLSPCQVYQFSREGIIFPEMEPCAVS